MDEQLGVVVAAAAVAAPLFALSVLSLLEADADAPDAPGIARPLAERAAEIDRSLAAVIEPSPGTGEKARVKG